MSIVLFLPLCSYAEPSRNGSDSIVCTRLLCWLSSGMYCDIIAMISESMYDCKMKTRIYKFFRLLMWNKLKRASVDVPEACICKIYIQQDQLRPQPLEPQRWWTMQILIHVALLTTFEKRCYLAIRIDVAKEKELEWEFINVVGQKLRSFPTSASLPIQVSCSLM